MSVRVRFAPAPSGELHVGNLRTALFAWLFARHEGGAFILRIEDTDVDRVVRGSLESIMEALRWLGLEWDEGPDPQDLSRDIGSYGPYVQSRRLEHYGNAARELLASGHAYHCYCSPARLDEVRKEQQRSRLPPKYDRRCRDLSEAERRELAGRGIAPVVRFKTPLTGQTAFHDVIRGDLVFENDTLDDFVLVRADGFPVYHLAHVVDDHLMAISHVLRGDEWLSSTPRHVLLYRALGWQPPTFAHLPMILGPDGARLGKRHGATSVLEFRDRGFLPEALFNFLGLLGWSLDDHTEIIDRETFVRHFSLERILKSPAVFNMDKLTWMNGMYIRQLSADELARRVRPLLEAAVGPVDEGYLTRIVPLIQERIRFLSEAVEMADFFFREGDLDYWPETLLGKKFAGAPTRAIAALETVLDHIDGLEPWEHDALEGAIRPLAEELGLKAGELFGLMRVAVTGKTAAPPLFETMAVLGRQRTLERLRSASRRLPPK
ncbi:MAG: glutamate--tRNA ligase [Chloroflexi bacterium]|nr:glutamate--tRNA ligase [Chloroflexota bacterium]